MANQINTVGDLYDQYYGKGAYQSNIVGQLIRKADDPIITTSPGIINPLYGAVVDTLLNMEADGFKLLGMQPMNQTGFRIKTGLPATLVNGMGENALLPDTVQSTFSEEEQVQKYMMTRWEITKHAIDRAKLTDSVGDLETFNRVDQMENFTLGMNRALLADAEAEAAAATADRVAADNIKIESLDRIISSDSEEDVFGGAHDHWYDAYLQWDRDAGTTYDSQVNHASGADRNLTLDIVDDVINSTWSAGARAQNQIFLTGMDTFLDWSALIDDKHRIETTNVVQTTINGVQTATGNGVEGTIRVAAYDTVPIFRSQDVPTDGASRIFLLDQTSIHKSVLAPTTYMQTQFNNETLLVDALKQYYAYLWVGEIKCTSPVRQGKIRDLA
jgi:hypothetical protein